MTSQLRSLLALATAAFICFTVTGFASAAIFEIDQFRITKNGSVIFNDQFDLGGPPPQAPNFGNGNEARYYINNNVTIGTETGGAYQFDAADGAHITSNVTGNEMLYQRYRLGTNRTQGESRGLRSDDDLILEGLFAFYEPGLRERYGIRMVDYGTYDTNGPNDIVQLDVRETGSGDMIVRFAQADFTNDTFNTLDFYTLTDQHFALYDQILFQLYTDVPDGQTTTQDVYASFTLIDYDDGQSDITYDFDQITGNIFNGEDFTRAEFFAGAPVPVPSSVLLLGAGLAGIAGIRRRKAA